MPVDWGGAVVYGLLLMWSFVGVSIIADVFMSAIEVITSAEKLVQVGVGDAAPRVPVKVWNATVANLTLMALGSSAPEILLGCIEILTNDFVAGELGPGVIVGSAAFNLLIIIAVCIVAIPAGETRKIAELGVFSITAASSVLAYLWMYFILALSSPNVIELWEAVVTFLLFPVLVALAYGADTDWAACAPCARARVAPQVASRVVRIGRATRSFEAVEGAALLKEFERGGLSNDDAAALLSQLALADAIQPTRAHRRIEAIRAATGGKRVLPPPPTAAARARAERGSEDDAARWTSRSRHSRPLRSCASASLCSAAISTAPSSAASASPRGCTRHSSCACGSHTSPSRRVTPSARAARTRTTRASTRADESPRGPSPAFWKSIDTR